MQYEASNLIQPSLRATSCVYSFYFLSAHLFTSQSALCTRYCMYHCPPSHLL